MPGFLTTFNNVTRENVTSLVNNTDLGSFAVKINNVAYNGYLFFIILGVITAIVFLSLQRKDEGQASDQPLINLLYAFSFSSILSLLLRAVYITELGVTKGLLTDHLMWVYPIGTILLSFVVYISKEKV